MRDAARESALRASQDGDGSQGSQSTDWRSSARYSKMWRTCEPFVQQLRVVLQSAEAKERERAWLRLKSTGDLDETRLVDAAIGERQVFKQRGTPPQRLGAHQSKPKRISFLLDASASMHRGDGFDGRLQRMGQTAVLLMEALRGFEHKFDYCMTAHSGSTPRLPLVEAGSPPVTVGDRAAVVEAIFSHAG